MKVMIPSKPQNAGQAQGTVEKKKDRTFKEMCASVILMLIVLIVPSYSLYCLSRSVIYPVPGKIFTFVPRFVMIGLTSFVISAIIFRQKLIIKMYLVVVSTLLASPIGEAQWIMLQIFYSSEGNEQFSYRLLHQLTLCMMVATCIMTYIMFCACFLVDCIERDQKTIPSMTNSNKGTSQLVAKEKLIASNV